MLCALIRASELISLNRVISTGVGTIKLTLNIVFDMTLFSLHKNSCKCVPYLQVWNGVPWLTSFSYERRDINLEIPKGASNPLKISYTGTCFSYMSFIFLYLRKGFTSQ